MKNLTTRIAPFIVAFFTLAAASAQSFEGVINYKIDWQNLPAEMADYASMLPSEATGTVKGHMYKFEQQQPMGGKQITIVDNEDGSGVMLMDMMGKKQAVVMDAQPESEESNQPQPEFEYMDETKKIAGYDCKKAIMTVAAGEQKITMEIFYTEEISGNTGLSQFEGLKGFPLQYSTDMGQFTMVLTADKVEEKKVSDDAFSIPEGYEHVSVEELQRSMGGGQ